LIGITLGGSNNTGGVTMVDWKKKYKEGGWYDERDGGEMQRERGLLSMPKQRTEGGMRYLYSDDRCWGPGRWQVRSHLYQNKAEKTIADN
jgi:hypothetical protein